MTEFPKHVPEDWDHLYFNDEHMKSPLSINDHAVCAAQVHRTHARSLRGEYLQQAFEYPDYLSNDRSILTTKFETDCKIRKAHPRSPKQPLIEVNAKTSIHMNHHFGAIHRLMQSNIYAPSTWLVGQAADRRDIMNENSCERFWNE